MVRPREAGGNDHKVGVLERWPFSSPQRNPQIPGPQAPHRNKSLPTPTILWNSAETGAEKSQQPSRHLPTSLGTVHSFMS